VPTTAVTTAPVPTKSTSTTPVVPATTPASSSGGTGVVPGVGAPHTGGEGEASSSNRLLGSSLLAGGLALAAGEALRRRRENASR
jgi:hypothetical protein